MNFSIARFAAFASFITITSSPLCADSPADQEPLPLKLPGWRTVCTPPDLKGVRLDPAETDPKGFLKPRRLFLAPKGVTNIALNKPVASSDNNPVIGDLTQVTDGDKEPQDGSFVALSSDPQWVQIDLQSSFQLSAIVVWHRHDTPCVFRNVVVQISDNPTFPADKTTTLFNNDTENKCGRGVGKDYQYIESNQGKLIDAKQLKARYIRLYSNGSTAGELNEYTEVEAWGLLAK
jgi:hypothetical protein